MSERALWDWLRGILPRGHFSRIEAPDTAPGFPDVHYTLFHRAGTGTIELKFSKHPNSFTPFKRDGLRQSQVDWINLETGHGGTVWIVGQVGNRVFWVRGEGADLFNDMNVDQLEEFSALIHPRRKIRIKHIRKMQELMANDSEDMYVQRQKTRDQMYRVRHNPGSVRMPRPRRTSDSPYHVGRGSVSASGPRRDKPGRRAR